MAYFNFQEMMERSNPWLAITVGVLLIRMNLWCTFSLFSAYHDGTITVSLKLRTVDSSAPRCRSFNSYRIQGIQLYNQRRCRLPSRFPGILARGVRGFWLSRTVATGNGEVMDSSQQGRHRIIVPYGVRVFLNKNFVQKCSALPLTTRHSTWQNIQHSLKKKLPNHTRKRIHHFFPDDSTATSHRLHVEGRCHETHDDDDQLLSDQFSFVKQEMQLVTVLPARGSLPPDALFFCPQISHKN